MACFAVSDQINDILRTALESTGLLIHDDVERLKQIMFELYHHYFAVREPVVAYPLSRFRTFPRKAITHYMAYDVSEQCLELVQFIARQLALGEHDSKKKTLKIFVGSYKRVMILKTWIHMLNMRRINYEKFQHIYFDIAHVSQRIRTNQSPSIRQDYQKSLNKMWNSTTQRYSVVAMQYREFNQTVSDRNQNWDRYSILGILHECFQRLHPLGSLVCTDSNVTGIQNVFSTIFHFTTTNSKQMVASLERKIKLPGQQTFHLFCWDVLELGHYVLKILQHKHRVVIWDSPTWLMRFQGLIGERLVGREIYFGNILAFEKWGCAKSQMATKIMATTNGCLTDDDDEENDLNDDYNDNLQNIYL